VTDPKRPDPLPVVYATDNMTIAEAKRELAIEAKRIGLRNNNPKQPFVRESVDKLVDQYFQNPQVREEFREALPPDGRNTVYLVAPSTTGVNRLPYGFAKRLERDYGGQVVDLKNFAKGVRKTPSKSINTYIGKMRNPTDLEIVKPGALQEALKGRHVVWVDDVFTTGESTEAAEKALAKLGIGINQVAVLGAANHAQPADADTLGALAKILHAQTGENIDAIKKDIILAHGRSSNLLIKKAIEDATLSKQAARDVRGVLRGRKGYVRPVTLGGIRSVRPGQRVLPTGTADQGEIHPLSDLPLDQAREAGSGGNGSILRREVRPGESGEAGEGTSPAGPVSPPPHAPEKDEENRGLDAAPFGSRRSRLKGRAGLDHLPHHVPATERECYGLLRQAVAVYQNLYPALWRRFRRGGTSGHSGLETQFRDASGRITPESIRGARISVQEDKLARDLRGLSPRQTVFHMEHALGEEVRHLASLQAALTLWEHGDKRIPFEPWLTGYFSQMWQHDFSSPLRTAVIHAYAGNYGDPSRGNKMTYFPQDWQLAFEGLRMLSQARAGTLPTEADQLWHWPKHVTYPLPMLIYFIQQAALSGKLSPHIEWMLHAMDQLMRVWHQPAQRRSVAFGHPRAMERAA
jgi:hypothetical protein